MISLKQYGIYMGVAIVGLAIIIYLPLYFNDEPKEAEADDGVVKNTKNTARDAYIPEIVDCNVKVKLLRELVYAENFDRQEAMINEFIQGKRIIDIDLDGAVFTVRYCE